MYGKDCDFFVLLVFVGPSFWEIQMMTNTEKRIWEKIKKEAIEGKFNLRAMRVRTHKEWELKALLSLEEKGFFVVDGVFGILRDEQ